MIAGQFDDILACLNAVFRVFRDCAFRPTGYTVGYTAHENRRLEGKRMASGHTGNVVLRKELWVRLPCPPLLIARTAIGAGAGVLWVPGIPAGLPARRG
jgi:hypothetical protein